MESGGGFYYNSNSNQTQFTNPIQTGFRSTAEVADQMFHLGNNESTGGGGDEFDQNMMVVGPWGSTAVQTDNDNNRNNDNNRLFNLVEDESCLRCVFPCEPNERPSQGLSLSLSSSNPSSIGLQSFELIRPQNPNQNQNPNQSSLAIFQLRNSRFLVPAQELLYEFCSLGEVTNNINKQPPPPDSSSSPKQKATNNRPKQPWELQNGPSSSSSSTNFSLIHSLDFMELQKRKTKLFSMLEEVKT